MATNGRLTAWCIWLVCLIAPSILSATTPLTPVVSDGVARSTIVLGQNADNLDRLAAAELQNYIEKLSGVPIKQISESEVDSIGAGETILLLGGADQNAVERSLEASGTLNRSGLKKEGFVLKTLTWKGHPLLAIAGVDPAGTLYGTYELLERLGVTFRLTGDILAAKNPNLSLPDLDVRMTPALTRRGFLFAENFDNASMYSWADYERMLDQMARMKCNYL